MNRDGSRKHQVLLKQQRRKRQELALLTGHYCITAAFNPSWRPWDGTGMQERIYPGRREWLTALAKC